ncbi:hypothetical protein Tco_1480941, partial [Tanacetum coccineum]
MKERLFCIFIYAENDGRLRRKLWANLIAFKSMSNNNPLVMLGDLNVSLHLDDNLRGFLVKLRIWRNFKIVPMLLRLMIFVVLTFIILGPKAFIIQMQSINKDPGPDGFTTNFYKKSWPINGDDVCNAVKKFFVKRKMLRTKCYFNHLGSK